MASRASRADDGDGKIRASPIRASVDDGDVARARTPSTRDAAVIAQPPSGAGWCSRDE